MPASGKNHRASAADEKSLQIGSPTRLIIAAARRASPFEVDRFNFFRYSQNLPVLSWTLRVNCITLLLSLPPLKPSRIPVDHFANALILARRFRLFDRAHRISFSIEAVAPLAPIGPA